MIVTPKGLVTNRFFVSNRMARIWFRISNLIKLSSAPPVAQYSNGADTIIARSQRTGWINALLARRPYSVVVAALANKLARIAWAVLTKGQAFDQVR